MALLAGSTTWLTQDVTVEPFLTRNAMGQNTYGTAKVYKARVDQVKKLSIGQDGQVVTSALTVTLDGSVTVSINDRLTLPDGSKPKILAVERPIGPSGSPYVTLVRI